MCSFLAIRSGTIFSSTYDGSNRGGSENNGEENGYPNAEADVRDDNGCKDEDDNNGMTLRMLNLKQGRPIGVAFIATHQNRSNYESEKSGNSSEIVGDKAGGGCP